MLRTSSLYSAKIVPANAHSREFRRKISRSEALKRAWSMTMHMKFKNPLQEEPSSSFCIFRFCDQALNAILHDNMRHKVGSWKYISVDELLLLTLSLARGDWYYSSESSMKERNRRYLKGTLGEGLTSETKTHLFQWLACVSIEHFALHECLRSWWKKGRHVWLLRWVIKLTKIKMSSQRDFDSESDIECNKKSYRSRKILTLLLMTHQRWLVTIGCDYSHGLPPNPDSRH